MSRRQCSPVVDEGPEPVDEEIDEELGCEDHGEGEVQVVEEGAPALGGSRVRPGQLVPDLRLSHVEQEVLRRKCPVMPDQCTIKASALFIPQRLGPREILAIDWN